MSLKLLKSTFATLDQPDYVGIYSRAISKKLKSITDKPENFNKDWKHKFLYLTIKGLPIICGKNIQRQLKEWKNGKFKVEVIILLNYNSLLYKNLDNLS